MLLISLSILPTVLLLVSGVTSVDLYKSKRVPRRNTEVTRTYNSNHPPIVENYDDISGIYEGSQQNGKRVGIFSDDEKNNMNYAKPGKIALNPETRSVHHQPSVETYDSIPISIVNDYDGETILTPKARSINIPSAKEKGERLEKSLPEKTQRIRSQQIRKVKMNKSQLEVYVNETESSVIKTEDTVNKEPDTKKIETVIDQTRANEQSFQIPKGQKFPTRGKQLRDPIVPIVESESYVFSHSGDFHYRYTFYFIRYFYIFYFYKHTNILHSYTYNIHSVVIKIKIHLP